MLICICKGLSERAIHGTIRGGATTVEEIGRACGAGTDCGTCQDALEDAICEVISPMRLVESQRQHAPLRARCAATERDAA
jgi:bacterioferritin-associated ferredoxin